MSLTKAQKRSFEKAIIIYNNLSNDEYKGVNISYKTGIDLVHIPCNTAFNVSIKKFNQNKFSCGNKECINRKREQTNLRKYGSKNISGNKQIKEKKKKTLIENYGVNSPLKNKNILRKSQKTTLKRYGSEIYSKTDECKAKVKKTNLERYGIENYSKTNECKAKVKKTNLERYGVDNPFKNEEIKEKIRETNLERYGIENYSKTNECKAKVKKTNLERYGVDNPAKNEKVKEKISFTKKKKHYDYILQFDNVITLFDKEEYEGGHWTHKYKWKCSICGNEFKDSIYNKLPRCLNCYPIKKPYSNMEREIQQWISKYIDIEPNKRFYYDKQRFFELDIYIAEFNIGIELDGLYWHSEISGKKDKRYHLSKHQFFNNLGIQTIHIWDIEWINKQSIVKSIILNKLNKTQNKIAARKCIIKKCSYKGIKDFIMQNHIQGAIPTNINLGLFYDNKLISVMSFNKSRFNKNFDYELVRFVTKINYTVIGGFNKLLSFFKKHYTGSLISYVDKRLFNGNSYKNSFKLINETKPNYYYLDKNYNFIYNRLNFQKHKLKKKLNIYNEHLTEWENMQINGYDRIWDCGNLVFQLIRG